jgi:hypothetical protein
MSGTNGTQTSQAVEQPWPFLEEMQDRQRAIAMHGAEPWNDPVEQRRAVRRRDMEILRLSGMEAALHVTEYIAGRLPPWKRDALAKVANPVAALTNLNRSLVQLYLAEERFDESAEERAARVKAEAEARAKAEAAEAAERAYTASQVRRAENKRQVQQTVRAITLTSLRLSFEDREKILGDLFRDLDAGDAYDCDPAETIAGLCVRLGVKFDDPAQHAAHYRERKARLVALARAHLAALTPDADEPGDDDEASPGASVTPFAASAKAQGPPN